ncbi:YlzJ-like family protein [Cohnella sp. AR92]|uniref:YlzJ-like family protein n=1 Tax=Cohnella sp. AR92 TaxID=648716 RepID=UPI000F8F5F4D|nr:YlzJ-like family protein [Cohnella sp. AR92]RUS48228.1 hypothetical protein ELR57_06795 [Cohnella sp. AR92]
MILYTCMPTEKVLEGWENGPGTLLEIEQAGLTMLVAPVAPGVGRLVRLVAAPLDAYLNPGYSPGSLVSYGPEVPVRTAPTGDWQTSSLM